MARRVLILVCFAAVAVAFLLPRFTTRSTPAMKPADRNNLVEIGVAARLYAQTYGAYPHAVQTDSLGLVEAERSSLLSLSLLVRENLIKFPEVFISPASTMSAAEPDLQDREALAAFELQRYECNYGWSKFPRSPDDAEVWPLAATAYIDIESHAIEDPELDPAQCFDDGIHVLYSDGEVRWVPLDDIKTLAEVVRCVQVSELLESYVAGQE